MPVQILKLTSGETIMCDVLDASDRIVTIINPLMIETEQVGGTRMNMVAYQWLPMMEEENIMYIHQHHIVGMAHANQDMQEYYVEAIERILFPKRARERELERAEEWKKLADSLELMANNTSKIYH